MLRFALPLLVGLTFGCGLITPVSAENPPTDAAPAQPAVPEGLWERDTLTGDWGGLRDRLKDSGIVLGLQEQSEVWGNLSGGLRRGATYDGLTTASLAIDLNKLVGWEGATFFANAFQIHGRGPSLNLVGNLQTVSGVEATRSTRLYNLWLQQEFWDGRLSIRIGQEGADNEMILAELDGVFMNSTFGAPVYSALNMPSGGPNYPLATPMVRVKFKVTPQVTVIGALFNGDPAPPGEGDPQRRDPSGTTFRTDGNALGFLELWYSTEDERLPGTYKLGAWYHSGNFADLRTDAMGRSLADPASDGDALRHRGNYAIYAVVNQMLWRPEGAKEEGLGVFARAMGGPGDRNLTNLYLEAGLNWTGPFASRKADVAGIAVAYAHISGSQLQLGQDRIAFTGTGSPFRGNETVIEATYQYQVAPWWMMQPDLQYVINPGIGIPNPANGNRQVPLKNAWVIGVRATITF